MSRLFPNCIRLHAYLLSGSHAHGPAPMWEVPILTIEGDSYRKGGMSHDLLQLLLKHWACQVFPHFVNARLSQVQVQNWMVDTYLHVFPLRHIQDSKQCVRMYTPKIMKIRTIIVKNKEILPEVGTNMQAFNISNDIKSSWILCYRFAIRNIKRAGGNYDPPRKSSFTHILSRS